MTGLKALVIFMGLLIVVGLGLVGYGVSRSHGNVAPATSAAIAIANQSNPAAASASIGQPAQAVYFASEMPVPRGSKLASVTATSDRLILHFTGASEGDRLVLLDAHNGQVNGNVTLVPENH